ncbi:hypothetical protein [Erythrobacter colymbi]|uniref:hypothetical protein n=1 Tax=Erythrobacter colymbi TaxID=1161202 RepID=UPI000A36A08B|nr:hypothetical protein [Erythrobacter colymbi]
MTDLRTISPDELPELSEIPADLRAIVFSPTGPLQAVPYDRLLSKLIAADLAKANKAALDADLAHAADSVALVFNDATAINNGWYRKVGASGVGNWTQFEELARSSRILAQAAAATATAAVEGLDAAAAAKVTEINDAGAAKVGDVNEAAAAKVTEINDAGAARVGDVNGAGAAQVAAVATEGANQIALATAQAALAGQLAGSVVRANLIELEDGIERPRVMIYQSGANRWRRTASGYAIALANEERRCFGNDGSYLGNALERGDTYWAPPLNNKTAYAGTADLRRFDITNLGTDTRLYPGQHTEADILGGTGAGMLITQGNSTNAFGTFNNVNVPVLAGQLFSIEYGLTIEGGAAGQVAPRSSGGRSFSFTFNHDATGEITGYTENWGTFKADFSNGEIINGKRRVTLHVLTTATANGNVQPGFGWPGANAGRKITVDWVKVRVAPVAPMSTFPVYGTLASAQVVLADDVILTGLGAGFGYIFQDVGLSRSVMPSGQITVPAILMGGSLSPIERKIRVVRSPTTTDRAGPNHTGREDFHFRPWQSPANHTVFAGPGAFPNQIGWNTSGSTATNLSITPVFRERAPDLAPMLRKVVTSQTYVLGALDLSASTLHAASHDKVLYWQQTDIPNDSATATHWVVASTNVNLADTLVLGCRVEDTRARDFAQEDEEREHNQYMGELLVTSQSGGTIDFSRFRADSLARISPRTGATATAATVICDDSYQRHVFSDNWFWTQGTLSVSFRRVVQGPGTAPQCDLYQSRRPILVNLLDGNGWQTLAAAGKTAANLPCGRRAKHLGTYDFGTDTETRAPEFGETCIVRYWDFPSSSGITSRTDRQWNASQVARGGVTRFPRAGDVFVLSGKDRVTGQTMQVKITADLGFYNGSNVWTTSANPALMQTGTHADHFQVNRTLTDFTLTAFEDVFMFGSGQGPFLTGDPALGASGSIIRSATIRRLFGALSTSNAVRSDWSRPPTCTLTLRQSAFVQIANPYRYSDGSQVRPNVGAAGPNNVLDVDATVVISGDNAGIGGVSVTAGATLVGSLTFVPCSAVSAFTTVTDPTAKPQIRDLVHSEYIDPVSRLVKLPDDFRDFRVTSLLEEMVGWAVNDTFKTLCDYHRQRSDRFVKEWERLFIDDATRNVRVIKVPNTTPVGTVLVTGLRGSDWHWFWGAGRNGWVSIDNQGRAVLARALTGLNRMLSPMMTTAEEVLIFDVTA